MNELAWESLKTLNCPKCDKDLECGGTFFKCLDCGFVITEIRLREVVEEMFTRDKDYYGRADFEELMEAVHG